MAIPEPRLRIFFSGSHAGFTDHLAHGDGLVAASMAFELARRGHEVHIAGTKFHLNSAPPANVTLHQVMPGVAESLKDRVLYAIRVRRLYNSLSRFKPFDIVHQLNPVIAGLSLGFMCRSAPLVLGAYIENWKEEDFAGPWSMIKRAPATAMRNALASLQQIAAAKIVLTTRTARNRVPLAPLMSRKLVVIPHGVDVSAIKPERNMSYDNPTILYLASLIPRKGIFTLMEAFDVVFRKMPNARLVIAGHGPSLALIKEYIAHSPASENIELLGKVDRDAMASTMSRATIYCLPSHGEPFGMTALEAMACGLPVVVTRECGLGEVIPDSAGLKVPMRDVAALADALVTMLSKPASELLAIGQRNRIYAERVFALPRVADELERVYRSIL